MEHYDVVIVGAGIAGCGLAYNLSRICPDKSVLVIDKKGVGSNEGYGYRNTTKRTVKEYGLKYDHIFDGIKVGTYDNTYLTVNKKFYFINYKKTCECLIGKSNQHFKNETAEDIKDDILITDKKRYSFECLIDASGHGFFTRKRFNKPIPFRYWVGITRVLKNRIKLDNYFYHQFSDYEYLEDFYPLGNRVLQGDWQYLKRPDFRLVQPHKKTLYSKYVPNPKIDKIYKSIIPCAHVPPLINKKCVCLGDSFGNAYTSSACGIQPILESSLILTEAIRRNNLQLFSRQWKDLYLGAYNKFLASKLDTFNNGRLLKLIKNYPTRTRIFNLMGKNPEIFLKLFNNDDSVEFSPDIKNEFPLIKGLFNFIYRATISINYKLMDCH